MRAPLWLILLTLGGCAEGFGAGGLSDRLAGSGRVRGDAEEVVVTGFESRVEALPLAVAHCSRFGRSAQFDRRQETGAYRFRCVPG